MPATHEPRFETYEVVNKHTGKVISEHTTRSEAESHKTDHAHRVRGGRPVKSERSGFGALLRGLRGLR